jgi:hypothetical protein
MPNAEINEICDVIRRGKLDKDNIHQLAAQKCIGTTKICEELHQSYLNVDTYDQLARWCEMKRRMPIPEDHFRSIARILYGKALKRI